MKFKDGDPQTQRQRTSWSWSRRKESCAEWGNLPFSLSLTLSLFHSLYLSFSLARALPGASARVAQVDNS